MAPDEMHNVGLALDIPHERQFRLADGATAFGWKTVWQGTDTPTGRVFGVGCQSDSLAGQAMNRNRGTQAVFQFSMVLPHTAHSKLLISRASTICSLRS